MRPSLVRSAALFLVAAVAFSTPAAADTTLRFATLAPEGSSWMKLFRQWQQVIEKRTAGRVKIKVYSGGVQGDERDVLRKIKLGQLSGGAVTGIGLSTIDPEARALDVARSDEELAALRSALDTYLRKRFDDKGYILLSWGDVGPVRLFSNRPVKTMADLQALKLWLWSDDPISKKLFGALDIRGVPMGVPDVLPGLQTGSIDALFASPLAAIALQWSTHVKYVTSLVVSQATGATVVAKKAWDEIAPADQAIVLEESKAMEKLVLASVRTENESALESMRKRGVEVVATPPELEAEMRNRTRKIAVEAGAGFSAELNTLVRGVLGEK